MNTNETSFPTGESLLSNKHQSRILEIKSTPYDNEALSFSILIPADWSVDDSLKAESPDLNTIQLKPLGIFAGPPLEPAPSSFIQIHAIELPREITAEQWLRHYAATTSRSITSIKAKSASIADSIMSFELDSVSFTGRAMAMIEGNVLYLVFSFSPTSRYEQLADIFGLAVNSFKPLAVPSQQTIEKRVTKQVSGVTFEHPASWIHSIPDDPPKGRDGLDLYQLDDNRVIQGIIRLKVVVQSFLSPDERLIDTVLSEYKEANVIVGHKVFGAPVEVHSTRFKNGSLRIFQAHVEGNDTPHELWICLFEDPKNLITASLLTPDRNDHFITWCINKRAFEIILESAH